MKNNKSEMDYIYDELDMMSEEELNKEMERFSQKLLRMNLLQTLNLQKSCMKLFRRRFMS